MASRKRRRSTRGRVPTLAPRYRAASPCWVRPEKQPEPAEMGDCPPTDTAPTATRWVPADTRSLLVTVFAKSGQAVLDADPDAVPAMVRETAARIGDRPFWVTISPEVQADAEGTPYPNGETRLNDVCGFSVPVHTPAPASWVRAVRDAEQMDRTFDRPRPTGRTLCLEEFVESRRAAEDPQMLAAFAASTREAARRDPSHLWDRPLKVWREELNDWWFRRRLVDEGALKLLTPDQFAKLGIDIAADISQLRTWRNRGR